MSQTGIYTCAEFCDVVCVDIPCESEGVRSSVVVLETAVKGQSLIITDAPVMVEAVAYRLSPRHLTNVTLCPGPMVVVLYQGLLGMALRMRAFVCPAWLGRCGGRGVFSLD